MSERVPFKPKRTCECPLFRSGYAGTIIHRVPCKQLGVEWLAQSGDTITPGKRYRWINDPWRSDSGYDVIAEVTRINRAGMVYAYWHRDQPHSDQFNRETSIPHSAVVELVE